MLILGIDDAGRGPVIGPMILAGCLVEKEMGEEFRKLGVKDSKQLTDKRREFLAEIIRKKALAFEVVIVSPDEIDGENSHGTNLNDVEAIACAEIINKINKGLKEIKVIIDCPSVSIEKWKNLLKTKIKNLSNLEIVCEHKADKNYAEVSAASILAKSAREKEMSILKEKYGEEIGSGYTSDLTTCRFLEKYAEKHKEAGIFRQTWTTWKKAYANLHQKTLV